MSTVKLQPLDDIFEDDAHFQIIKLDTQGSELDILRGGSSLIEKADVIIMEISYIEFNEGAPTAEETIDYMKTIGFDEYIEIGDHFTNTPK